MAVLTLLLLLNFPLALQHPAQGAQEPYVPDIAEASDEASAALARVRLPLDFELKLWASEPDLANPVCLYVDHRGRVFVAMSFRLHAGVTDMREHMDWLEDELAAQSVEDRLAFMEQHEGEKFKEYGIEHEHIRRLADTDGDGTCDESIVFAEGFNHPGTGIAAGLLVRGSDVWYGCIPDLWKLTDADDDGRAESREVLHTGYGVKIALLGHDLHGLRIGPDGRLYFSIGDRGLHINFEGETFHLPDRGSVLRCELDGSGLEVFASGLRNPQELVFDDYGNLFTGDNNSDGGDKARWVYVVQGGDTGWRHHYQYVTQPNMRGPWNAEGQWKPLHDKQPWFLVPPIANVADGPSGLCMVPDVGWSEEQQGAFLLCDFRGSVPHSSIMEVRHHPVGAGFAVEHARPWVRDLLPTDCDVGPDGALYVSDWVNGWNMTGKGRVFRLAPDGLDQDPAVQEQKSLLAEGMGDRDWEELAQLLGHPGRAVRQEAQLELCFRAIRGGLGSEALRKGMGALLSAAYHSQDRPFARLHGIWGVGLVARMEPEAGGFAASLLPLAEDMDPEVRVQTLKVLGELQDPLGFAVLKRGLLAVEYRERAAAAHGLASLAEYLEPEQRHACLEPVIDFLIQAGATDPWLRHAGVRALEALGTPEQQRSLLLHEDPNIRRLGVVVLRRKRDGFIVEALADSDPAVVEEAARAIHEVPLSACTERLAELLVGSVERDLYLLRRSLAACREMHRPLDAQRIAAWIVRPGLDRVLVHEGIAILAEWSAPSPIDRVIGSWRPIDGAKVPEGLDLAALLGAARNAGKPAVQAWLDLEGRDDVGAKQELLDLLQSAEEQDLRVAALRGLLRRGWADQVLLEELLDDPSSKVVSTVLEHLAATQPQRAAAELLKLAGKGQAQERQVAVQALTQLSDRAGHGALARLLRAEASAKEASPIALELTRALAGDPGQDSATALIAWKQRADADPVGPRAALLRAGGDAGRGRQLFQGKVEVSCLRCHRAGEMGSSQVGPDLTGVASRLDQDALLWSILEPNRELAEEFQAWTFLHQDGTMVVGRVLEEGPKKLVILDAEGVKHAWEPELVEGRRRDLSSMPEDLAEKLSDSELRDVLAFLSQLKEKPVQGGK